jgi:hypothetical protein
MRLGERSIVVRGHLEQRTTTLAFSAQLAAVPDAATGFVVQLLQGRAPGLFVRYEGTGEAIVEGSEGEPFLRLGPNGAEVNRRSPTWAFSAQAQGIDLAGIEADPTAPPDWSVVGSSPSFAWIDPRALIEQVGDDDVRTDWTVPVLLDGVEAEIVGASAVSVVPLAEALGISEPDDDRTWLVLGVVAASLVTLGGVLLLARGSRRSRPTRPS